jgi:hypothetical protein
MAEHFLLSAAARSLSVRFHGTTGEAPIERFRRAEAAALRPVDGRPPFHATRELIRRVQSDCAVEVETNSYSVPWRLIGERVRVTIAAGVVRIANAGKLVATHEERTGRRERAIDPAGNTRTVPGGWRMARFGRTGCCSTCRTCSLRWVSISSRWAIRTEMNIVPNESPNLGSGWTDRSALNTSGPAT